MSNLNPKLFALCLRVTENIEELFCALDIHLRRSRKMYTSTCEVHGGDNTTALNVYHYGDKCIGNWTCRTHGCHTHFPNNIIGFTQGVLSHQKYDWQESGDKEVSFEEAVNYLLKLFNFDLNNIKIDFGKIEKNTFVNMVRSLKMPEVKNLMTRNKIRSRLVVPADYYIKRGYSPLILDKYDIGLCTKNGKMMTDRVVVPVYDSTYKYMIGCLGRSIFEKCPKCGTYHNPIKECPVKETKYLFGKWKNSKDFLSHSCLYNYWFAKEHIKKSRAAILVESVGNVLKLEEAGIKNSVGIFGTELSTEQRMILDSSGALSLILIMDNDKAGKIAAEKITQQCEKIYNVITITPPANDIGEMNIKDIQDLLPKDII